ncbi:unnamed protein product, partial [Rotaria socialis]
DLAINLRQPLPMTPIASHQSTTNDNVSSTITVVKTDHMPIPHTESKRSPSPTPLQLNSISAAATTTTT